MVNDATHEQTLNDALGEVLGDLRVSWRTRTERIGRVFIEGGRPDILIEEASGWPVVIEAERESHVSAEDDAKARLGLTVASSGRKIETAIALVYPPNLHALYGAELREGIENSNELEYALYTRMDDGGYDRLPGTGWVVGGVRDLARFVNRASIPSPRLDALTMELENGVRQAEEEFTQRHGYGSNLGDHVADILGQSDDEAGQTRRMAMTVIANALVFHESLAEVEFQVPETEGDTTRSVRPVGAFRIGGLFTPGEVCLEWDRILSVNYWPIFWSAKEMLHLMPTATAHGVLNRLWRTAQLLVAGGVTRSHDLTGNVFQRLIADREFLATYYTRPEAAALLSSLALPSDRPPGGADWGDGETLAGAQVGDFACGTGTLLSTAYQRMSLLHELHGGDPRELHGPMMRHGLVGLDVLNMAVHLTAAMLAGSHPDTPFDGECLLTMPYGEYEDGNVMIGSLDLLAENVQPTLMDTVVAVSAGGRAPEEVRDLVARVGHATFDLVIMNPPFTRSTGMEADRRGTGNPAFAAFDTKRPAQGRMQRSLNRLRGGTRIGSGNSGLAADFLDLALRKVRSDGVIALVLPLSAVSGIEWETARGILSKRCQDILVVTIAGAGSNDSSFSADTGMAECLLVAQMKEDEPEQEDGGPGERRATFAMLRHGPGSSIEADLLADEISRIRNSGQLREIERVGGLSAIEVGQENYGFMLNAPLPTFGPWPLVGVLDSDLAQEAWNLERGTLIPLGIPGELSVELPIVPIEQIGGRGPYHADIYWDHKDGTPRGPFELIEPAVSAVPTYPMLWRHKASRERRFIVAPDSEGQIKAAAGRLTDDDLQELAADVWATASRMHYNRDLQFNSQSLVVAMTEERCIGGVAWPSVTFVEESHECAFALWCNSTLGILLHWWVTNKTQAGRGRTSVTGIPKIPTFDVRTLSPAQLACANRVFDELCGMRFLPFDQIDEDPVRAELDRRLLVDVLGLPETFVNEGGPLDLLRRKLAQEPQIHGGKRSRVVFYDDFDEGGNTVSAERLERRSDR